MHLFIYLIGVFNFDICLCVIHFSNIVFYIMNNFLGEICIELLIFTLKMRIKCRVKDSFIAKLCSGKSTFPSSLKSLVKILSLINEFI